jgi:hypothetical protein
MRIQPEFPFDPTDPFDPLDALLREDAAAARADHVDDAGFSARVVGALPPRLRLSQFVRRAIPPGFALLATVGVMFGSAARSLAIDAVMDLATETVTANAIALLAIFSVVLLAAVMAIINEK